MRAFLMGTAAAAVLAFASPAAIAGSDGAADGRDYIIQPGDSLTRISERFFEDPLAFPSIIEATNARAAEDPSYETITTPDSIHPGQKLWIPVMATLEAEDEEGHGVHAAPHWAYQGEEGPTAWGHLDHAFEACDLGREQSPISIPEDAPAVAGMLEFDYQPTGLHVVNNGHTIQVNYDPGSTLTVDGKTYALAQFHFHAPSEHVIDGVPAAMEMHLVHVADDGALAVVGLMLDFGDADNAFLAPFWGVMPPEESELSLAATVSAADAFDTAGAVVHYAGSLTTPPCSEGVRWFVLAEHGTVSRDQVAKFVDVIGFNARPAQPLHEREFAHN